MLSENRLYLNDMEQVCELEFPWNLLQGKTVLVTGANGLIASCLIDVLMYRNKLFQADICVLAAVRNTDNAKKRFTSYLEESCFDLVVHDAVEPWPEGLNPDYIVHAASNAHPVAFSSDPVGTMNANFLGMGNLLELAKKCSARVLYVSSGEVYGFNTGVESFTEDYCGPLSLLTPRACYPSGKRAAETLCACYYAQYNVEAVIARPCHVYGPTMTKADSRAVAQFIRNALNHEDIVMKSRGTQVRSMCYVADCAAALLTVLLKGEPSQAYNIAPLDGGISIAELAKTVADANGAKVVFELPDEREKKGFSTVDRAVLNAEKLSALGWNARTDIKSGVTKTIEILKAVKEW